MAEDKKKKFEKLRAETRKSELKKLEEVSSLLATRDKLERDYLEDTIQVTFNTSPQTVRTILARRPSNKEMIRILTLSAQAAKYEGSEDPEALGKMVDIYKDLHKIAAKLSVDESLDERFWSEKVSFTTLQNFITELINESQKPGISPEELRKFR